MDTFSALCAAWYEQVKSFFPKMHGHQQKTLAFFLIGVMRAGSIVLPRIAEALLEESTAKTASIERRLERFLSNNRFPTEEAWSAVLATVLPHFQTAPIRLVIDLTNYEDDAQLVYIGLLQHSRVLPLVWRVMPGNTKWDERLWEIVDQLCDRLRPQLSQPDCTLIGDSAFGCAAMVQLCEKYHWHYLFRVSGNHTCKRQSRKGEWMAFCPIEDLVLEPGKTFFGPVHLWQEDTLETNISGCWEENEEKPLLLMSDRPAGPARINEYRRRWRVEATFQDLKSRGFDWEACQVRQLDRLNRLLFVLFLSLWWLIHLGAACIRHGKRDRYDRKARRDKNIFRLGRLYLLDIERRCRRNRHSGNLKRCLLFQGGPGKWTFALHF